MAQQATRAARISEAMSRVPRQDRWHVIPDERRWVVIRELAQRATRVFPTQLEAVALARSLAQDSGGEVIIHGRDGRMRERQVVAGGRLKTVYGGDLQ